MKKNLCVEYLRDFSEFLVLGSSTQYKPDYLDSPLDFYNPSSNYFIELNIKATGLGLKVETIKHYINLCWYFNISFELCAHLFIPQSQNAEKYGGFKNLNNLASKAKIAKHIQKTLEKLEYLSDAEFCSILK